MNTVTIKLKKVPDLYLECESVTPDKFAGKSLEEIAALPCSEGKRERLLMRRRSTSMVLEPPSVSISVHG